MCIRDSPKTGEAMAIDPLDHEKCLAICKKNGWEITQVLNTHEHWDHIGGNQSIIESTNAKLLAHKNAKDSIDGINIGLSAGDSVRVGSSIILDVLDTPGHTMSHVCLFANNDSPSLFCGDTLFNAGVGHCKGGGNPEELYDTFINQLFKLPNNTRIYPGHDYWENNLKFTLDREPENYKAREMIEGKLIKNPEKALISTIEIEKEINSLIDKNTKIEVLADGFDWSEGPVWSNELNGLLFSDVPQNKIYFWNEKDGVTEFISPSGYTGVSVTSGREIGSNGLTFNSNGNLILAQHGGLYFQEKIHFQKN